ncbi:hypothetical protein AB1L05_09165 [Cytobacillus horneckiae]
MKKLLIRLSLITVLSFALTTTVSAENVDPQGCSIGTNLCEFDK